MSDKRRGLGRGLGALIPAVPEGRRPIDVFFPVPDEQMSQTGGPTAGGVAAGGEPVGDAAGAPAKGEESEPAVSASEDASSYSDVSVAAGDLSEATSPPDVSRETPDADAAVLRDPGLVAVPGAQFAELPIGEIRPNPRQPRKEFDEAELKELVGSIREVGLLQPVVVRKAAGAGYELIMGERRWRAAGDAGLTSIPAIIRDTDDADLLRDALLENLHRSALNPLEEAAAYRQLLDDFGCTHEELAERLSRSRPQISNTLRLLKLPPLVQRRVAAGVLSAGHARALLSLSDGAGIERLAQRIVAEGLSVRATEEIVALGGLEEKKKRTPAARTGDGTDAMDDLGRRLSDLFDTRVRVSLGKYKGRLTVEFASTDDLNRILSLIAPQDPGVNRK